MSPADTMPLAELARALGHQPDYVRRNYDRLRARGMPPCRPRLSASARMVFPRAAALAWLAGAPGAANDDVPLDDVLAAVRAELQAEYAAR